MQKLSLSVNIDFAAPMQKSMIGLLGFLLLFIALTGCQSVKLPVVMKDNPSLAEITQAVNNNSAKIQSLRSDNATVGLSGTSGWANCQIAFQRPQNLRLIATAPMVGRVVDFGSNNDQFWFWSSYQNSDQILWAKLNEYTNSPLKESIPVDPVWFPEALGIVEINPSDVIEGPVVQASKLLLIVSQRKMDDGMYKKYTYIEPKTAAVKRQDVVAPDGTPVVSVVCNEFQVDEATQAVLPKKLVVTCPKATDSLQLDLGKLQVNSDNLIYADLFVMPTQADLNAHPVNIGSSTTPMVGGEATGTTPPAAPATATPVTQTTPAPSSSYGTGETNYQPPLSTVTNSNEIPVSNSPSQVATSGDTAVTAQFRTISTPSSEQYTNSGQSYYLPSTE